MNFGRGKVVLLATIFALAVSAPSFANVCGVANQLYCQEFDGTGNAFASQNDTTGGNGNFATVYDNFTLGTAATVDSLHWEGEYFNPPNQGQITAWTVTIWSDNGGQPGAPLQVTHVDGTANETFDGIFNGFPAYTYSVSGLGFSADAGVQYWISEVPDLGFPPQWGNSSGTGGDGVAFQDFFGTRTQLAADMAFALDGGNVGVPEPGTLVMLGTGVLGLAGAIRRKLF
jgi:hypothetical protein